MVGSMMILFLTGCGSSREDGGEEPQPTKPTFITFYVYAPENPVPTRAVDDLVDASELENTICSFQIWVYTHETTPKLVGYLTPLILPSADGTVYQMEVSKEFADASPKPHVDVYVTANTEAAGLSFGENPSSAVLKAAVIDKKENTDFFGITSPFSTIDSEKGLPMSGVLYDQQVYGDNPVLRIGSENYDDMAKVQLQRSVSKVRFVFCRQSGADENSELKITGIALDGRVTINENEEDHGFPKQEYLFLDDDGKDYHIGNDYESSAVNLFSNEEGLLVEECDDPSTYIYVDQAAQDYEDLINSGVAASELSQVGPFYFRETDKQLSGTISYKIGNEDRTKTFSIETPLGFTRNHSWIVYAYYGSDGLDVLTVFAKKWTTASTDHSVHNW